MPHRYLVGLLVKLVNIHFVTTALSRVGRKEVDRRGHVMAETTELHTVVPHTGDLSFYQCIIDHLLLVS